MRTPTVSVTDLVKQIAREEVEKALKIREENIGNLQEVGDKYCESLKSDLSEVCSRWEEQEEALLKQEVRTAMAAIAKNHGRSPNAIVIRIQRNKLLEEARY